MTKTPATAIRATIAKLQRQLEAINKRQENLRREALAFLRDAQDKLGISLDDLRAAGAGKVARRGKRKGAAKGAAKRAAKVAAKGGASKRGAARTDTGASARRQPRGKRSKVAPKYRSPDGETWSGRGLKPRWLTALLAEGRKIEEFLIKTE
jgi:DNA-binding protein H-NS